MKYSIGILFYILSLVTFGQNKSMDYNKNQGDFEFIANDNLKAEFSKIENPKSIIQFIAKITNDTIVSLYLKNNLKIL